MSISFDARATKRCHMLLLLAKYPGILLKRCQSEVTHGRRSFDSFLSSPLRRKQIRKMQPYPPLGTLYAASAFAPAGMSVAVFDSMLVEPNALCESARRTQAANCRHL